MFLVSLSWGTVTEAVLLTSFHLVVVFLLVSGFVGMQVVLSVAPGS